MSELKKLKEISAELEDNKKTSEIVKLLIEGENVRIFNGKVIEGEQPVNISVTGEIVKHILIPLLKISADKRENLLAVKEQILDEMAKEALGEDKPEMPVAPEIRIIKENDDKPEKEKKKKK